MMNLCPLFFFVAVIPFDVILLLNWKTLYKLGKYYGVKCLTSIFGEMDKKLL